MTASFDGERRRSRYKRDPSKAPAALTPRMMATAAWIADLGVTTTPQLTAATGLPAKTLLRITRQLFDAAIVRIVPVPRAAIADPACSDDLALVYGSAPNVLTMTGKGIRMLAEAGTIDRSRPIPAYGPASTLMLRHQLLVGDVRIWFNHSAAIVHGAVEQWREGKSAHLEASGNHVRPDALTVVRIAAGTLVALVEADR